ncbi:hypothetical protein FNV43_RR06420 [Rhamnella rubrinervis]|uniref:Disease resistance protein RGA3 n=1 Tax=Rhamnella rubrinervis TaxID=2594499 RepID=A0A8K0HDI4_9ROSA|nr:hypothetical protein FNV43_RR06420 [Rhamnella rubrinervis]
MAEALIFVLLDPLISITTEILIQEVNLVKGVKEEVSSLKSTLVAIKDVLEGAEKKQLEDPRVRRWLDQLRDVSYDIDNVLDKWNTEILTSEIQKQNAPAPAPKKRKVSFPLLSSFFSLSQPKKLGILHEVAHEIKKLNETLETIDKEKHYYSFETTKVVPNKRRETTSLVDVSEVYGRDADKDYLISKLLCDTSGHGGKVPVIIPIAGMGGIGKTTLAQLAFNDEKVLANFDERVWVCVSEPFDEIGIAKAILEALRVDSCQNLNRLESSLQRIRESIEGKKFLLVLDDVWTEDREVWEQFIQPFRSGAAGSRILITTRKHKVATMMDVPTPMLINLELLSEEYCWSIFSQLAFFERNGEDRQQLEEVGKKIAHKCKGLPLQAKTLGGLMRFKETKRDWEDVLSDQIWESHDEKIKHFAPFLLSYYDLPPLEKRCFSYCSVFPKDYEFRRDELIEMWMSQGYLSSDENPENRGQNCFKNLIMQSFFQDFRKDGDGNILGYKMHDILHDLAQFLTKNECSTMEVDEENILLHIAEKVRHLTLLFTAHRVELPTLMLDEGNLRSLFIFNSNLSACDLRLPHQTSGPLRYLRTLNMRNCGISWLPGKLIGQLRHLRYLDLSLTMLEELPNEVCDLCNLQTLRLEFCHACERLPEGMGRLVNLRHLHVLGCYKLKGLPKGIGRLTQLRTLDRVVIPENNHEEYVSVGDLEKMNHLQLESAAEINGCGNLKSLSEAEKLAGLMKRGNQVHLILEFHSRSLSYETVSKEDDEFDILEALQPRQSLKSLSIRGYVGASLSSKWMTSLHNLVLLLIWDCEFFDTFPPLGRLPSLKELVTDRNRGLRKIGGEVMGITTTTSSASTSSRISSSDDDINVEKGGVHGFISFPKLKQLCFRDMRGWEEWEGCESATNMPCLHSLSIYRCDSLKSLPEFLKETPLQHLHIDECRILSESFLRSGKEWAHISHVPTIQIDYKYVKRDGNWIETPYELDS